MRTLQQFRLIAALAQHRHFGRASDALGMSQPALSKALKAIETELGMTLFDTADTYGLGHNETLLGRFIAEGGTARRRQVVDLVHDEERAVA